MAMGHFRREWLGAGSSGSSDVLTGTLPLTPGWEIDPDSVRVYRDRLVYPAYTEGTQLLEPGTLSGDDLPLVAADGTYPDIEGTVDITTGVYSIDEKGNTEAFDGTEGGWFEYYEYNPSVSDDYDGAWANSTNSDYPLILTKYAHSSFGSNVLSNHGTNCLLVRQQANGDDARIVLWKKGLETYQAIMSQVAFRPYQNEDWKLGPSLLQRAEDISSTDRWGYELKVDYDGSYVTFMSFAGSGTTTSFQRVKEDVGAGAYVNTRWGEGGSFRTTEKFVAPAQVPADDWYILRFITTVEKDDDIHLHALIARGSTEVDKASPTFETLFDVWHISGLATAQNFDSHPSVIPDASPPYGIGSWVSVTPQSLPPIAGRAGLVLGGVSGRIDSRVAYDSLAIHPMPGP